MPASPQRRTGIRAVLFDLDGVLIDSYEVWFSLLNDAARAFGAPAVTREVFARGWGQGVQEDVRFFPDRTVAQIEAYYNAHFMDHASQLRINPEAAGVLAALRERSLPTALITNTPGELAREILRHARLRLDLVVGGTDVPSAKPAPDMVLHACAKLATPPIAALVVGDSAYDRAAAAAAGARFAGLGIAGDDTLERLTGVLDLLGTAA